MLLPELDVLRNKELSFWCIVENHEWATQIVNYRTINFYNDNINLKYAQKVVEPIINESSQIDSITLSEKLETWERKEIVKITEEDAQYFWDSDDNIFEDVSVVWYVYDMNTDTYNGKMAIGAEKTSMNFKKIRNTPDFVDLVNSLKTKALVKVDWKAEINLSWASVYKNIEIFNARLIQQPVFWDTEIF